MPRKGSGPARSDSGPSPRATIASAGNAKLNVRVDRLHARSSHPGGDCWKRWFGSQRSARGFANKGDSRRRRSADPVIGETQRLRNRDSAELDRASIRTIGTRPLIRPGAESPAASGAGQDSPTNGQAITLDETERCTTRSCRRPRCTRRSSSRSISRFRTEIRV
jgi:hypothetical protein